jgi:hypothetical protein
MPVARDPVSFIGRSRVFLERCMRKMVSERWAEQGGLPPTHIGDGYLQFRIDRRVCAGSGMGVIFRPSQEG